MKFSREEVESSRRVVYAAMSPTPQYAWPLLRERLLGLTGEEPVQPARSPEASTAQ